MPRLSVRRLLEMAAVPAVLAIALTAWVATHEAPLPGDLWLTHRIQEIGRLESNAELVNTIGVWRWLPFGLVTVAVVFRKRLGGGTQEGTRAQIEVLLVFAAVLALQYGDEALKRLVQSPRPVADLGVRIYEFRESYGFPSGHVYGDLLMYGAMAVYAPAWVHPRLVLPVRAVSLAIIMVAGPARVAVGAHWPSDALGGYLWGGTALCLALVFGRWAARRV